MPAELFFKAVGVRGYKYGGEHRLGGEVLTAHPKFDPDTGKHLTAEHQWDHQEGFLIGALLGMP